MAAATDTIEPDAVAGDTMELAEVAEDTAQVAEDTAQVAEDTVEDVTDTVEVAEDTVEDVADTVEDVTDTVGDVTDTVGDVADAVGDVADAVEDVADAVHDGLDCAGVPAHVQQVVWVYDGSTDPPGETVIATYDPAENPSAPASYVFARDDLRCLETVRDALVVMLVGREDSFTFDRLREAAVSPGAPPAGLVVTVSAGGEVAFPRLGSAGDVAVEVTGGARVVLPALTTARDGVYASDAPIPAEALPALAHVRKLAVSGVPASVDLAELATVDEGLAIRTEGSVAVALPALTSAGGVGLASRQEDDLDVSAP
ncbi:MAG: hypothetical protein KC635_28095, partial [Myxococcales bacterium]|nr:hypothetical protein [Myxococcales bacterium]